MPIRARERPLPRHHGVVRASRDDESAVDGGREPVSFALSLYAPSARRVEAVLDDATGVELPRVGPLDDWVGEVPVGARYLLSLRHL